MISLHHVGYVVENIDAFAESLPGINLVKRVYDPVQIADIALYSVGNLSQIELIQPLSADSFTWSFLGRSGSNLHHICYQGVSSANITQYLLDHRLLTVRGPIPSTLFERDVLFAYTRNRTLLEFLL